MNLELIRTLTRQRVGGLKRLAGELGLTEATLHRRINDNDISASYLEKAATLLDVPVVLFFSPEANSGRSEATAVRVPASQGASVPEVAIGTINKEVEKLRGKLNAAETDLAVRIGEIQNLKALLEEKNALIAELKGRVIDKEQIIRFLQSKS